MNVGRLEKEKMNIILIVHSVYVYLLIGVDGSGGYSVSMRKIVVVHGGVLMVGGARVMIIFRMNLHI